MGADIVYLFPLSYEQNKIEKKNIPDQLSPRNDPSRERAKA